MNIKKEASVLSAGLPDPSQLEQINRFAKTPLEAEEVYVFSVRLCDDQPDRDYERFDTAALPRLAELFVGKTGIVDHAWSAENQLARIFATQVEQEGGANYIKAWAYMRRGSQSLPIIEQIEAGIKKEVSVGCSMGRSVCSVCGAENGACGHVKGQMYGEKLCFMELKDPKDAYEWSFVAVPAQPRAGVVKGFREAGTLEQLLSSLDQEGPWREELKALRRQAEMGRRYLDGLRQETVRLGLLAEEGLGGETLRAIADRLEEPELERLRAMGVTDALAGTLDSARRAAELGFTLRGDYGLGVFNGQTLKELKRLGFRSATLSFELKLAQIRDLSKGLDTELVVYGRLPLMITENCIIHNHSGRHTCANVNLLTDRKGERFPVVKAPGCRNEILNSKKLFLADKAGDWQRLGLWAGRLMFTTENARECVQVLERYLGRGSYQPNDYTRGLYYRGVE